MKIALYIEDGLEQVVLTPESNTERGILGKLHDGSRELTIAKGSFFECRGGYERYMPYWEGPYFDTKGGDESTIIVLRPASAIEAPSGVETGNTDSTEGESAVPKGETPR